MVVITDSYLNDLFGKSGVSAAQKSHLTLPRKCVTKIELLSNYCSFKLIDLRNNDLRHVRNIRNQNCLTYLFLQNNSIKSLEGFTNLRCLETLYLDGNKIEVIEGLEMCPLKKLSVSGQRLEKGQALAFDPTTMRGLAFHLEMLNVSSNNLLSIKPAHYLLQLEILDASENRISDTKDLFETLFRFMNLKTLNLLGNPLMKKKPIAKKIVAHVPSLSSLNGLEVTAEMHAACDHMSRIAEGGDWFDGSGARSILESRCRDIPRNFRPCITASLLNKVAQTTSKEPLINENLRMK